MTEGAVDTVRPTVRRRVAVAEVTKAMLSVGYETSRTTAAGNGMHPEEGVSDGARSEFEKPRSAERRSDLRLDVRPAIVFSL
jgi:hypothetical protein